MRERVNTARCSSGRLTFELSAFPDWRVSYLTADLQQFPIHDQVDGDIWLNPKLLQLLNEFPQGVTQALILLESKRGESIYISAQELVFKPGEQVRQAAEENETNSRYALRNRLAQWFSFRVLSLGQFMVSGLHGLGTENSFQPLNETTQAGLIHAAAKEITQRIKGYHAILIKDLCADSGAMKKCWQEIGYYPMPVDPSMELDIHPDWKTFDDYLLDISSKYRVRYRRTRKQLPEQLDIRILDRSDCEQLGEELYQLYLNVKTEAAFDAVNLSPCYFASLKNTLEDKLTVKGYFLHDQLIGFTTTIENGGVLHAHYLGFDQDLNREYQLYHNMLFDLLAAGIAGGFQQLDYGRTALEIKSSIGAVPRYYFCGLLATNSFYNRLIPIFTPAVFKPQPWTQRNPLKRR